MGASPLNSRICIRSICLLVLLNFFLKFSKYFQKKIHSQKQLFSHVPQGRSKKFAKFTRKHQCWSQFLIKSPKIKILQDRCFPVNFAKPVKMPFLQNTSGGVGVCLLKSCTLQAFTKMFLSY